MMKGRWSGGVGVGSGGVGWSSGVESIRASVASTDMHTTRFFFKILVTRKVMMSPASHRSI